MSKIQVHNNLLYNTKTGSATLWSDEKIKRYAAIIRAGHCGKGYFIPILVLVNAPNVELAVDIAMNLSRIKNAKNNILALEEISELEHFFLDYINDCDPYLQSYGKSNIVDNVIERRVVMEEVIKDEISHPSKNIDFYIKDKEEVKIADDYDQKYVLQRYFAPRFIGDKLVFPKKVKIRDLLHEYLREQTKELGVKYKKPTMLSYYYQMYGPNNDLGIEYNDGIVSFYDENCQHYKFEVKPSMFEHLEDAKKYWESQIVEESVSSNANVEIKSARDRFNARLLKTKKINDEESEK